MTSKSTGQSDDNPEMYLKTNDGINLGHWVNTQRAFRKKGKLIYKRFKILDYDPYWVWEPGTGGGKNLELRWIEIYDEMILFINKNNHINVNPIILQKVEEN